MAASVTHRHGDTVSIFDLVARSRALGPPLPVADTVIPVEIVECVDDASAEAYITAVHTVGATTHVHVVLDHGLPGEARLPAFDAEWLALDLDQIVPVRIARWMRWD